MHCKLLNDLALPFNFYVVILAHGGAALKHYLNEKCEDAVR
jgi:hypothetical protein